jgi:hypothetical protein
MSIHTSVQHLVSIQKLKFYLSKSNEYTTSGIHKRQDKLDICLDFNPFSELTNKDYHFRRFPFNNLSSPEANHIISYAHTFLE